MSAFAQEIQSWQGFYALAGAAAATLVGLLFIAVSLHLDIFTQASDTEVSTLAEHTLINYFSILMIALFFLIPQQSPNGLGLPLLGVVLFDLIREARGWFNGIRARRGKGHQSRLTWRFVSLRIIFPILYDLTMLYVAVTVLSGSADALDWLVWVIVSLLISASMNAWNMLVRLSVVRQMVSVTPAEEVKTK